MKRALRMLDRVPLVESTGLAGQLGEAGIEYRTRGKYTFDFDLRQPHPDTDYVTVVSLGGTAIFDKELPELRASAVISTGPLTDLPAGERERAAISLLVQNQPLNFASIGLDDDHFIISSRCIDYRDLTPEQLAGDLLAFGRATIFATELYVPRDLRLPSYE